jgi:hypothetical protein
MPQSHFLTILKLHILTHNVQGLNMEENAHKLNIYI